MAVVSSVLKTSLEASFNSYPSSVNQSAVSISNAIQSYLASAMFGASIPTFTNSAALLNSIKNGMNGNLSSFVAGLQTGVSLYLTAVPIAGASGVGVSIPPTGNLSILNAQLDPRTKITTSQSSQYIATAIDIMVKTTTASLVIPPAAAISFTLL